MILFKFKFQIQMTRTKFMEKKQVLELISLDFSFFTTINN